MLRLLILMVGFVPALCAAQTPPLVPAPPAAPAPPVEASKWKPLAPPSQDFDFSNFIVAKAAPDKSSVMLLVPRYDQATRIRTVKVTKLVEETRTRVVKDEAGNDVEQTYTVQVPLSVNEEQQYRVTFLAEVERISVPLDEIRAWRVSGESIDSATLVKQLAEATHLFAVKMHPSRKFTAIEPYYAEMLRPGSIVLYLAKEDASPAPAPNAAPAAPSQPKS